MYSEYVSREVTYPLVLHCTRVSSNAKENFRKLALLNREISQQ
jgi:hypothetical protein